MPREFTGMLGGTLTVKPGTASIRLKFEYRTVAFEFHLDPNDFGDMAAALWECSPTKQEVRIGESNGPQLGIFEDPAKDTGSTKSTAYQDYQREWDEADTPQTHGEGTEKTPDPPTDTTGEERG